ncbi:hypothetical protein HMI54_001302 [Coelomomyces lativittatus]|nr:hypothetical protein HMI55_002755 [Coelomomyces lativittatus]KAJ1506265.1 hypothetical protein HMI56_000687 [Coelomomyces lativittatus]KAJ1510847.1 hypothetical protein HMI54_001302 [Coelomomyces lativittatus]
MEIDLALSLKQWLLENKVCEFDPQHSFYVHDPVALAQLRKEEPWTKDPHYFKHVYISAMALIKMVIHARSGGALEIMGLVQGKVMPQAMVVMDAYALPVEGTETRVNAHQDAYEYMVQYQSTSEELGRVENVLGWYHSHPGYGCWLSGVDVSTQISNQTYQEPFLAIVIDPNRTVSSGRVDIGAFRTFPESYVVGTDPLPNDYPSIPLNKIEDFGVHANQYYSLSITIFKSPLDTPILDLLWQRHWVNLLSQSPLQSNQPYLLGQMKEVVTKLKQVKKEFFFLGPPSEYKPLLSSTVLDTLPPTTSTSTSTPSPSTPHATHPPPSSILHDVHPLGKAAQEAKVVSKEMCLGMVHEILKKAIFNSTL